MDNIVIGVVSILWGGVFFTFHRSLGPWATRQNEALWVGTYNEKVTVIAFKYGGLLFILFGVLVLVGVIK